MAWLLQTWPPNGRTCPSNGAEATAASRIASAGERIASAVERIASAENVVKGKGEHARRHARRSGTIDPRQLSSRNDMPE